MPALWTVRKAHPGEALVVGLAASFSIGAFSGPSSSHRIQGRLGLPFVWTGKGKDSPSFLEIDKLFPGKEGAGIGASFLSELFIFSAGKPQNKLPCK